MSQPTPPTGRRVVGLVACAVAGVMLATSSPVAVAAPRDTSADPLERAAFTTLPAVYELVVELPVRALVVNGRSRPIGQPIRVRGAAFGVAPNLVATARHLVRPGTERILEELRALGVAALPDTVAGLRFVTESPTLRLRRATVDPVPATPQGEEIGVEAVALSDPAGDVAVLTIEDPEAPTVRIVDAPSARTDVAILGFGGAGDGPVPELRLGSVQAIAQLEGTDDDRFVAVSAAIRRGDSGGPAVTADGDVVGLVLRRERNGTPAVLARVSTIRDLLEGEGVDPRESDTSVAFRAGMDSFWRRDYDSAAAILSRQVDRYRDTALAGKQAARAVRLEQAPYVAAGPSRLRRALLTLGILATIAATAMGLLRIMREDVR